MSRSRWVGRSAGPAWYCAVAGLFFAVRAATTLAGGASFNTPGTGWRAVFQLGAVAVLAVGLVRERGTRICVGAVGAVYAIATIAELFHRSDLLGVIPVDNRDRIVHPLVAVAAALCLLIARRASAGERRGKTGVPSRS